MNVTIPPPFEVEVTPVSLIFVVGAVQAFLMAIALWRKPFAAQRLNTAPGRAYNPNRLLVVLIALFGLEFVGNFFDQTGYLYYLFSYLPGSLVDFLFGPSTFLYGPLIYFYTKSMVQPGSVKYRHHHLLHLLPFIVVSILNLPLYFANSDARLLDLYDEYYLPGVYVSAPTVTIDGFFGSSVVFDFGNYKENLLYEFKTLLGVWMIYFYKAKLLLISLVVSYSVYVGLSFYSLRTHRIRLSLVVSAMDAIGLVWLKRFLQLCMLALVAFILLIIADLFLHITLDNPFIDKLPEIILVGLVYYIGYNALRQPQIFSAELAAALVALETPAEQGGTADSKLHRGQANQGAAGSSQPTVIEQKKTKYQNSSLPQELSESLANDIRHYVETNKPYLNSQLTLPQLASELDLSTHMLSQLLNETIGQNFFDFINAYRVKETQQLMLCAGSTRKTVLELGTECGFNSNSAFYNAFKKHAGITPSQWKKQQKSLSKRDASLDSPRHIS